MDAIIALTSQYRATQFVSAAGITLWVYDYLVTFLEEIEFIWGGNVIFWLKVLFLSNRLVPVLGSYFIGQRVCRNPFIVFKPLTSLASCRAGSSMIAINNFLQSFVIHIIFTMRIWTISYTYPRFRIVLVATLIMSEVAATLFTALHITKSNPYIIYTDVAHTCLYTKPSNNLYPILITLSALVIETVIFGATSFHTFRFRRSIGNVTGARSVGILKRLGSQGAQYYLIVILFRLTTIFALYFAPLGLQSFFPTINFYLTAALTARFVLTLQREIVDSRASSTRDGDYPLATNTSASITMRRRVETSRYSVVPRIFNNNEENDSRKKMPEKTAVFVAMEQIVVSDRRKSIPSPNPKPSPVGDVP
ncbi:hypothetical protein FS842_002520 [Serendipita sp. 407]|nr:hypothetical protein FS842_002520 [Serendipita sp. 407]